jgi:hypothetical protein
VDDINNFKIDDFAYAQERPLLRYLYAVIRGLAFDVIFARDTKLKDSTATKKTNSLVDYEDQDQSQPHEVQIEAGDQQTTPNTTTTNTTTTTNEEPQEDVAKPGCCGPMDMEFTDRRYGASSLGPHFATNQETLFRFPRDQRPIFFIDRYNPNDLRCRLLRDTLKLTGFCCVLANNTL